MNQSEIFMGEKQYDSTTDSGLFTPSDTIRKVLNAAGHSFRANASSLVVSTALHFKLVKKMIHATNPPPPPTHTQKKKKYHNYSFLEGKCHLELYEALNFYANICLHHDIKGLNSKSAQKSTTKSFYSSSLLTSWDK